MPELTTYVQSAEAARRLGLSPRTLVRRLQEVPTYRDPQDRRRILIAVEDLERLATPIVRSMDKCGARVSGGSA